MTIQAPVKAQGSFSDVLGQPIPTIQILDVGAMATGQERYHGLLATGLAQVTGFEPNPAEFARLKDRPGPYRYLPHFLGAGGPATFHLTRYPGCSSLLEPDPEVSDLFMTIGASPIDGSSSSSSVGRDIRARPIAVICCSPPETWEARSRRRVARLGKRS